MVNPAFSESQLKNLRRQNRHLVSTHRRKLVFLQASRNPAHGSGRPFFVRDVPVPASFCSVPVASAFAPPAPVSAAPQLRPFHRPRRSVPSSPSLSRTPGKVRVRTVHAAVPHPRPAPRERSRPTSFCPAPVASAFAPPAPVSAAPQLRPFHRPRRSVPSSPSLSRTPGKVRVRTVHAAVPHPRPAPRERSRPTSFCPAPVASAFAPPAPVSAAPQLRPFCLSPPRSDEKGLPDRISSFGNRVCRTKRRCERKEAVRTRQTTSPAGSEAGAGISCGISCAMRVPVRRPCPHPVPACIPRPHPAASSRMRAVQAL